MAWCREKEVCGEKWTRDGREEVIRDFDWTWGYETAD